MSLYYVTMTDVAVTNMFCIVNSGKHGLDQGQDGRGRGHALGHGAQERRGALRRGRRRRRPRGGRRRRRRNTETWRRFVENFIVNICKNFSKNVIPIFIHRSRIFRSALLIVDSNSTENRD